MDSLVGLKFNRLTIKEIVDGLLTTRITLIKINKATMFQGKQGFLIFLRQINGEPILL